MIKSIKPFIDLGWHTVPMAGELSRLPDGKKTLPKLPADWRNRFTAQFNENVTSLGGVITGEASGIIAIDCDNTVTYNMFKALDKDYKFHFISKGKRNADGEIQDSAVIIYKRTIEAPDNFIVKNNTIELDYYNDHGFVYLPTEANHTKEPFELCDLKEPPPEVLAMLVAIKPAKILPADTSLANKEWHNHLCPQLVAFCRAKKVIPKLFTVLTPKDFRDLDKYQETGFLSPEDVPEGRGSEYLSKISAIIGADRSVDIDLYIQTIEIINNLFTEPMPKVRLSATIIEPMVEERSSIDGMPIWQFDQNWEDDKFQVTTKRNEVLDTFFDSRRLSYYATELVSGTVKQFGREADFASFIMTVSIEELKRKEIQRRVPLVNAVSTPAKEFGFFYSDSEVAFNTFYPTEELAIFREPLRFAKFYSRPTTTLRFLESLIPDIYMRNYLLQFLRRKFDLFEYSPVVLYLLGVPGAGKDTLMSLIELIIGSACVARPTVKEFLEMYNGWLLDKYFVQLDEYGNQLTRFDEKENALGKIKAYSGKQQVQIRQMRTDGFNYIHSATIVMTANANPLMVEGDDRRMALFECPNNLPNELWVQEFGGITKVITQIKAEVKHFCYYLATEVSNLSADSYQTPPSTTNKKKLIASKFGAGQRIAFLLSNKMFVDIEELATFYAVPEVLAQSPQGRIQEDALFELYCEMTEDKGTKRGLTIAMKTFTKVPTTHKGQKSYYYDIPHLAKFSSTRPFTEITDDEA